MEKMTLKFDCILYDELAIYLEQLNGINNVIVDNENDIVDILYNPNFINVNIIKKEIELFLGVDKIPSIIGFDKYPKEKLSEYYVTINDLCCEYCLKGFIGELLMVDGIESAFSDFDYIDKKNVKIVLKYDEGVIDINKIIELEKEFNS